MDDQENSRAMAWWRVSMLISDIGHCMLMPEKPKLKPYTLNSHAIMKIVVDPIVPLLICFILGSRRLTAAKGPANKDAKLQPL